MNHRGTMTAEYPAPGLSSNEASLAADLPLPALLLRFSSDVTALIAGEMAVARAEFAEKIPQVRTSAGLFGAASMLGLGAFLALTATLIAALSLAMPVWAASLIVTIAYGAGAAIAALRGKAGLTDVAEPLPRISNSLKADVASLKAGFERGR